MPYKNVPDELQDKMESCVQQVTEGGQDKETAIAICYTSVVEGKSLADATKAFYLGQLDAMKVGARNSAADAQRLQMIHDYAVENGAECKVEEVTEIPMPFTLSADTLVYEGGSVKALGNGKVGGYLVRFGSPEQTDAEGEFFAPDTDYGDAVTSDVYYHHAMDSTLKAKVLGKAELRRDDVGVWAEAQLKLADEYEKKIYELAEKGKLGWSSGTAPHLVMRESAGKARKITRWPLGLDASLTPTPAEPRNRAIALKSLITGQEAAGGEFLTEQKTINPQGETIMTDSINIEEVVKRAAEEAVKSFAASLPPVKSVGVAVTKDESENEFATLGEFLMAVKSAATPSAAIDARLKSRASEDGYKLTGIKAAAGLNELVPSQGGYLLQNGVAGGLIERMYSTGEILRRVSKDSVGPNSNGMTYNALDETSRVDSSRWGGVLGYWLAEAGTKQATKPKFRQLDLKLQKVAALCYATDELLQDATALESWLARTMPEELKFQVEDAIFNGDGAGKPIGIFGGGGKVEVSKETGQAAATVVYQNLIKMHARLWVGSRSNAVWFINQDVEPWLNQVYLAAGTSGIPANFVSYDQNGVMRIFGKPVVVVEHCQTVGTVGDITLADLSQYQLIDKGGVQMASSIHLNFLTDETAFRAVYRVAGEPIWASALTPAHGTNTVAPVVTLATR